MPDLEDFINNPPRDPPHKCLCGGKAWISDGLYEYLKDIAEKAQDGCNDYCECCRACEAATDLTRWLDEVEVRH